MRNNVVSHPGSIPYHTTRGQLPQQMEGAIVAAAGSPDVAVSNNHYVYSNFTPCLHPIKTHFYSSPPFPSNYLTVFRDTTSGSVAVKHSVKVRMC